MTDKLKKEKSFTFNSHRQCCIVFPVYAMDSGQEEIQRPGMFVFLGHIKLNSINFWLLLWRR
jgi:hypothetical protein